MKSREELKQEFIKKAKLIHGNKYDYSDIEYLNSHTSIQLECSIHGIISIRPYAHIPQKQGCRKCGLAARKHPMQKTSEEFIKQAKSKWGEKYNYSKTNYINKTTKIVYECLEHGEVEQKPTLHLKHGCPYCSGRGIGKYSL